MVHQYLKKAKRRQERHADKNSQYREFQVDDPVYLKQQQKRILQGKWYPYYRTIEKPAPVTFSLKIQLYGTITKAHAEHSQLAQLDN